MSDARFDVGWRDQVIVVGPGAPGSLPLATALEGRHMNIMLVQKSPSQAGQVSVGSGAAGRNLVHLLTTAK